MVLSSAFLVKVLFLPPAPRFCLFRSNYTVLCNEQVMTQRRKPLALFLTIVLVLSTVVLSSSTNAEETSARVTNNEEIVVSVNDIYYDRGGDITFTVTSTNLDPATEYTIDWNLCNYG